MGISDNLAQQVASIFTTYKTEAKKVVANKTLNETQIRAQLNLLMDEKNAKLWKVLNTEQLEKLIPTNEKH